MRLTLFITGLNGGGAERVLTIMANYWAGQGHSITLLSLTGSETDIYPLSPLVERIGLNLIRNSRNAVQGLTANFARIRKLRSAFRASRPDAIISFIDVGNVMAILASKGLKIPTIVSERTDPRHYRIGKVWNRLRRLAYPFAGAIVVQSEAIRSWAETIAPNRPVRVIPNPVVLPPGPRLTLDVTMPGPPIVVAMGRLSREKGFDILLEAFAHCSRLHPEWSLVILGEGNERKNLEAQVCDLGMKSRVHFLGSVSTPSDYLQKSDLFVLSSRFEGFPNALLEAMSCGLPVISFACPSGPSEIITHGKDGNLVPPGDARKLGEAMEKLMSDQTERARLGTNAIRVLDRFNVELIMTLWENVIAEVKHQPMPDATNRTAVL